MTSAIRGSDSERRQTNFHSTLELPLFLPSGFDLHHGYSSRMLDDWSHTLLQTDPMRIYRAKRDAAHRTVTSKYNILGFISSGTYGRVYKAQSVDSESVMYAIKKFKPDKEGDVVTYTGISQSAIREIAVSSIVLCSCPGGTTYCGQLNREISHENVVALKEVILEDKSIYMVFDYAEHDFLVRSIHRTRC